MSTIIFWACAAIYAAFIFEFGRNLDRSHYPDIALGTIVLLISLTISAIEVGNGRLKIPPPAILAMMVAFAIYASHYLYRQIQAWARRTGYIKPMPTRGPCFCLEDEDSMTRRVTSLHKETT